MNLLREKCEFIKSSDIAVMSKVINGEKGVGAGKGKWRLFKLNFRNEKQHFQKYSALPIVSPCSAEQKACFREPGGNKNLSRLSLYTHYSLLNFDFSESFIVLKSFYPFLFHFNSYWLNLLSCERPTEGLLLYSNQSVPLNIKYYEEYQWRHHGNSAHP